MSIKEIIAMWLDEFAEPEELEDSIKMDLVYDILHQRHSYIQDKIGDVQYELAKENIEDTVLDVLDEAIEDYVRDYAELPWEE